MASVFNNSLNIFICIKRILLKVNKWYLKKKKSVQIKKIIIMVNTYVHIKYT